KVPHTSYFDAAEVKDRLKLIDRAWAAFLENVRHAAAYKLDDIRAAEFFDRVLGRKPQKPLGPKAARDHAAFASLFRSAPGQGLGTAKGTLWGAVNAVSYYVDHVRVGGATDRVDSAWFGAGASLKE